jgi:hypothetical protein
MRDRLACERGFTVMEVAVAATLGMVVMLGGQKLLSSSSRASAEVADRVDGAHRARDGMEAITARLRSQVCLNDDGPAIVRSSPTSMDFFAIHGNRIPSPVIYGNVNRNDDTAQARRIEFRPGVNGAAGTIVEYVWNSPLPQDVPATRYPEAATVFPALGTNGLTPTTVLPTRTLMTGVERSRAADGSYLPIFKYFKFQAWSPATPTLEVPASTYTNTTGDDLARVVRIEVMFDVVAERVGGRDPNPADRGLDGDGHKQVLRRPGEARGTDSTFLNEAYVRTADAGQPEESPECF